VDEADVYLLLLGPKYGDPLPDSGLAPTAEEFRRARNRGIPILVFDKSTAERPEPAQQAFKQEVGHYVNGRFWTSFTDPLSLNQAVGEALNALPPPDPRFEIRPLTAAATVSWLSSLELRPNHLSTPVLEVHLIPLSPDRVRGARDLAALASKLADDARSSGFVSNRDALEVKSDNDRAWAIRPDRPATNAFERSDGGFCGLVATAHGAVGGFLSLPTDFMGALANQTSLQHDIAQLLSLSFPHVPGDATLAPACALSPAERVWEGDPANVGSRHSSPMRGRSGLSIVIEPSFMVTHSALGSAVGDIAAELATRMINKLRQLPRM
jgi:hypothetical protein